MFKIIIILIKCFFILQNRKITVLIVMTIFISLITNVVYFHGKPFTKYKNPYKKIRKSIYCKYGKIPSLMHNVHSMHRIPGWTTVYSRAHGIPQCNVLDLTFHLHWMSWKWYQLQFEFYWVKFSSIKTGLKMPNIHFWYNRTLAV